MPIFSLIVLLITNVALFGADSRKTSEKTAPKEAAKESKGSTPGTKTILPNGLTVIAFPLPGADRIVLESLYKVGFIHEPKGAPQIAHLLEHLVTQGAIQGYPPGAIANELNAAGMGNAETMPTFTHYDYIVPTNALDAVLQIEANRLQTLAFDPAVLRSEIPKCYSEMQFLEKNPQSGFLKAACIALRQAWGFSAQEVSLKAGLTDNVEALKAFHRSFYYPRNATLVLMGPFKVAEALNMVKKHFGSISAAPESPGGGQDIVWKDIAESIVQWDLSGRAFCLAFPPPTDPKERLLMSLWGNLLLPKLSADPTLQLSSEFTFSSNQAWPVGTLPFFVYVVPKNQESLLHVQGLLKERVRLLSSRVSEADVLQIKNMLKGLAESPSLSWAAIQQQSQSLAEQTKQPTSQASALVMGNLGVQLGMRELLLGALDSRALAALEKQLTLQSLDQLVRRTLDPASEISTALLPSTLR
jgi:predicted Zn-dependent peptidase